MGKSVTSLGALTFTYIKVAYMPLNFTKVYFKGVTPPSAASLAFNTSVNRKLSYVAVPIGCKDAYMKAFFNYIDVIEEIEF